MSALLAPTCALGRKLRVDVRTAARAERKQGKNIEQVRCAGRCGGCAADDDFDLSVEIDWILIEFDASAAKVTSENGDGLHAPSLARSCVVCTARSRGDLELRA